MKANGLKREAKPHIQKSGGKWYTVLSGHDYRDTDAMLWLKERLLATLSDSRDRP